MSPTTFRPVAASLLIAGLCLFFFPGCATKIPSSPAPTWESPGPRPAPAKPVARPQAIPATQRPYTIEGKTYYPLPSAEGYSENGIASWYGTPFHGRKTSNGEIYNMYEWTAAHKTLPMQTRLLVENLENGRSTTVRINDRGPFVGDRIIDLSYNVARELEIVKNGTGRVRITALGEAKTVQLAGGRTETRFLPHPDFERGEFFVQVGAFTVKTNADRLRERLNREGRDAEIFRHERGEQVFYRVQVKAGDTMAAAKRMAEIMTGAGFSESFVVAR